MENYMISRTEVKNEVISIIKLVLPKTSHMEMDEFTTAHDVSGWDSLSHIVIILEVEKKFSIKFKAAEIAKIKNLGELIYAVESRVHQNEHA
jgi:acyl carrier protein